MRTVDVRTGAPLFERTEPRACALSPVQGAHPPHLLRGSPGAGTLLLHYLVGRASTGVDMPEISLRHVVSCSSQDSTHRAENLLKADTYRKWRSAKAGEKTISVVLQLEKEEQIHSVDIGNDGSAFVEVLVGSSAGGATAGEQDYEVLLVTSSFMSPSESRSGSNPNRVRIFGPDKLVRAAAEKRWDRVKIVCSQPYSKDSPYGLSFVKFHSPPDKDEAEAPSQKVTVTKLGQFRVKEEDDSANSLRPGALFFNRINKAASASASDPAGPSYAAATLQASSAASSASPVPKVGGSSSKLQEPPKGKRKLDLGLEDKKPPSKPSAGPPAPKRPKLPVPSRTPAATPASTPAQKAVPGKPRGEGTEPRGARAGPQELGKILQGVVVVLSGFQNPFRSELRDKALELGAKYRPDWTPDSTHLICAFANTPKYSQVLGLGGRIVRKEWVLDCYRMRRRLPSRRYLMAGLGSSSEDEGDSHSESGEDEAPKLPRKRPQPKAKTQAAGPSSPPRPPTPEETKAPSPGPQDNSDTDGEQSGRDNGAEDSGDTEDELRRVAKQREQRQPPAPEENGEDPYAGSTDENTDSEAPSEADLPIPELPDFFQGKHFFLYGEFPGDERRKLIRYVTAFNGELEDYMSDRVQFVITAQEWDPNFEEALMENPSLAFVRPRWIYSCNEKQKLLPHQLYGVVPQA
ncbi:DNA repair protein XRCC1 isoform X2 [Rattus norvegicus]|uniref:DNA repair protein XRCC1 isoform X2 n=1 Tax=Rattus norvegicus TaxID=10116 RepID=UPI0003D0C7F8|eukprot:XP_017445286.1 PREDICTED: DNA repair protein XRCC1 isoform X2 [Rattus norvegicus]